MKFVDIGEIRELCCVKSATKGNDCQVEAVGGKGTLRLTSWPMTLSSGRASTSAGVLFDLGLEAFLCQFRYASMWSYDLLTTMKEGQRIQLLSSAGVWECLRRNAISRYEYLLGETLEWVNCDGVAIPEPEDFRQKLALLSIYARQALVAATNVPDIEDELLDVLKNYSVGSFANQRFVNDHDFMMDWYEVTATAARTINNHIHTWKDFNPNMGKVGKFFDFAKNYCERMEKLCGRYEYAKHLWERKGQIERSRANGWKLGVEMVKTYKIAAFGKGT